MSKKETTTSKKERTMSKKKRTMSKKEKTTSKKEQMNIKIYSFCYPTLCETTKKDTTVI